MRQILLPLLLLVGSVVNANAATITFAVTVPEETPADASIYIAGDFQGWNPASPTHRFTKVGDRLYELTLELPEGRIEFKFTRGDWATVEKGPGGEEIGNRVLTLAADARYELTVAKWADLGTARTLTGNVTEHTVPGLLSERRVWVYLPPDYETETRSYPVLVMLDGQNVFDASTSFAGEWNVDETCEALIASGDIEPLIVVAVDNGGAERVTEYTPWYDAGRAAGGGGGAHLQTLVDVLLPWIHENYRTRVGPENTGFSGSSLGGLMSVFAAHEHAATFGRVGALSPSIWWDDRHLVQFVADYASKPEGAKLWIDMGTLESNLPHSEKRPAVDPMVEDLRALRDQLASNGWTLGTDLVSFEDEGARHNESAWSARFPEVLRFLFPKSTGVGAATESVGGLKRSYR